MYNYRLSHARSGIYLSIINELENSNQEVLIPDFICESIPNYLISHNIKIKFYKINYKLKIDWQDLKAKLNKNSKFLILVNYFGFPLDLNESIEFSKKNNLILIEDNTHGFNGSYQGKTLGTFGDYGVSSPRKHIQLNYGGILYTRKKMINYHLMNTEYKSTLTHKIKFHISRKYLYLKLFFKKFFMSKIHTLSKEYENIIKVSKLDNYSNKIIDNTDWIYLKKNKFQNYEKWRIFAKENNLNSLIDMDAKDLNPWAYPILASSESEAIDWLNWGIRNNIIIFNWPTLHDLVDKNSVAFDLSKRTICFSTYIAK